MSTLPMFHRFRLSKTRGRLLFIAALLLSFLRGEPLRAEQVQASGLAVIIRGNQAAASSQAQAQAVRSAVEKLVIAQGGPKPGADSVVDARVYAAAHAFVTGTSIVSERADGNILTVEMSVDVDAAAVRQGIGDRKVAVSAAPAPLDLGRKRLLILATEQLGPEQLISWVDIAIKPGSLLQPGAMQTKRNFARVANEMGTLNAMLAEGFTTAGWSVIDPSVLQGRLKAMPRFEPLNLTDDQARAVAQKTDADAVVIVKGVAKLIDASSTLGVGTWSGQANVVARLVRVKDGQVLAASTQHSAQVHMDPDTARIQALTEATRQTSSELVSKLKTR